MANPRNRVISASTAYRQGEKPLTKINMDDINYLKQFLNTNYRIPLNIKITLKKYREYLKKSGRPSWHRTSLYGNKTNFYSFAYTISDGKVTDLRDLQIDQVNELKLNEFLYYISQESESKNSKENENQPEYYYADVSVGVWEEVKHKPKLVFHKKQAVIKGKFAYILGSGEKKRLSGSHFRINRRYMNEVPAHFNKEELEDIEDQLDLFLLSLKSSEN